MQGALLSDGYPQRWADVPRPPGWAGDLVDRIARKAFAVGLGPSDLVGPQFDVAGWYDLVEQAGWSAATEALYAKALRRAGLPLPLPPTPAPHVVHADWRVLWDISDADSGEHMRSALWCALTRAWAPPRQVWSNVTLEHVQLTRGGVVLSTPAGRVLAGDAHQPMEAWMRWRRARPRLRHSPWLLATLARGATGTPAGSPLSTRALQLSFRRHVGRTGIDKAAPGAERLTYETYRRMCLADGAAT